MNNKNGFNDNQQNNNENVNVNREEIINIPEETAAANIQNEEQPLPNDYDDFITTEEDFDEADEMFADQENYIQNMDDSEMPKESAKKNILIAAISGVCVVLVAVFCFLFFSGTMNSLFVSGGNEVMTNAISAEVEDIKLNGVSDNYVLASGIFVNGESIGNMKVSDARKKLENYVKGNDFKFTYTIKANDKTYTLKSEGLEFEANIEGVLATAAKYTEENKVLPTDKSGNTQQIEYVIPLSLKKNNNLTAQLDNAAKVLNTEPVDAKVTGFNPGADNEEKFTFDGGTDGQEIDYDEVIKSVNELLWTQQEKGEVLAKTNAVEPKITKEKATENMVPISTFTTTSTNTANANHNMATALAACNGSIIEPGEIWSFNDSTGNSNLESNGYVPATVIANGEYTSGVGGGLCQASSTIYNAALYANLGIVERYNHYWASPYVYTGFDATIDWGNLDLKLQNNTEYSMYLECYMEGTTLTATFYGWKDPSFDGIVTYSYNYEISGSYYGTEAFRIYIKDGKEIDRETLPSSSYKLDGSHSVWYADPGTLGGQPGVQEGTYPISKDPNDTGYWAAGYDEPDPTPEPEPGPEPEPEPTTQKPTEPPTTEPPTTEPTEPPTTEPPATEPTEPPSSSESSSSQAQ